MSTLEEQRKVLLPILKRADEVQQQEPKIAYYCRLYAVQQALGFEKRQPDIDNIVKILMNRLEKEKMKLQLTETDQQHCETFAQLVFTRAEKMDQAGKWDQNTVIAYYSASYFIEICKQFGELAPDLAQMQKFAAWKASDLRKAIREGREPTPRTMPSTAESNDDEAAALPDIPSAGRLPQELPRSFQSLDSMPKGSHDASFPTSTGSGMPADSVQGTARNVGPESPTQPIPMPGSKAPDYPPPSFHQNGPMGSAAPFPQQPPSNGSMYPGPPPYIPPHTESNAGPPFNPPGAAQRPMSAGSHHARHPFHQGDNVHYKPAGGGAAQPAKIVGFFTRPDGQQLYTIAVAGSSSSVPATEDQLAQNFEPGERVLFRPPDKRPACEASVTQTDLSLWRPVYRITCDHGEVCSTGDECLTRLEEESRDPLMPPSSLPSKISTSPSEEADAFRDPYSPAPGTPKSSARTPPAFSFPATSGPDPDSDQPSAPQGPPDADFGGYPSLRSSASPQPPPFHQQQPPPRQPPWQQPPPEQPPQQPPWQQPQQPPFMGSPAPSYNAPPAKAAVPPPPLPPPVVSAGVPGYDPIPGYEPSLSEVTEAHKLSKYAASALSFEDIPTAIKHLTTALRLLTQPNQLKASSHR